MLHVVHGHCLNQAFRFTKRGVVGVFVCVDKNKDDVSGTGFGGNLSRCVSLRMGQWYGWYEWCGIWTECEWAQDMQRRTRKKTTMHRSRQPKDEGGGRVRRVSGQKSEEQDQEEEEERRKKGRKEGQKTPTKKKRHKKALKQGIYFCRGLSSNTTPTRGTWSE